LSLNVESTFKQEIEHLNKEILNLKS